RRRPLLRARLLALNVAALLLLASATARAAPVATPRAAVDYRVELPLDERAQHRVDVELTTTAAHGRVELWMPVWTPGAYELRTWGRNVTPIDARDDAGHALPLSRVGPSRFVVDAGAATTVHVRYRVYAAKLTDDGSHVDGAHALLNGSSIFLAVAGQEASAHDVHVHLPDGWRAATALTPSTSAAGATDWRAASYEALIDAPIECGRFVDASARAMDRVFRVVVDGNRDPALPATVTRLAGDVAKLAQAESAFVGAPPFRRYLVLLHLADEPGHVAALEHTASTSILVPRTAFDDRAGYDEVLYVVAHELFHAWNARVLRPADLTPYDLTKPQPSRALWITEGLSEYYAHRAMLRLHRWSRAEYVGRVSEEAGHAIESARAGLSLEDSAQATWAPPDFAGADLDGYYARGHLVALALDASIRAASDGKHTLADVLRALVADAAQAGGTLPIDTDVLAAAVDRVTPGVGARVKTWARSGDETTQLDEALRGLGLQLVVTTAHAHASAGFGAVRDDHALVVEQLPPEGAAALGGVHIGDRILAIDGSAPNARWQEQIWTRAPGAMIALTVARGDEKLLLHVTLLARSEVAATLAPLLDASAAAVRLRDAFLNP
ncbi:MAG TPA: hypothetical protein VIA18_10740, partial [Polyangia bacterium]|nr:hypothetical protein [Polyangia bacterium]